MQLSANVSTWASFSPQNLVAEVTADTLSSPWLQEMCPVKEVQTLGGTLTKSRHVVGFAYYAAWRLLVELAEPLLCFQLNANCSGSGWQMSRNCPTLTSCLSQPGGRAGGHARSGMSQTSASSMQIRAHKCLCASLHIVQKSDLGTNRPSSISLLEQGTSSRQPPNANACTGQSRTVLDHNTSVTTFLWWNPHNSVAPCTATLLTCSVYKTWPNWCLSQVSKGCGS